MRTMRTPNSRARSLTAALSVLPALALIAALALPGPALAAQPIRVLVSTFPLYLFTRSIAADSKALQVGLMLPAQLGCPHDYALTPQDMKKLAAAQALVINGLGLEEFLGQPIAQANPKLRIIDSSAGIPDLLPLDAASGHAAPEHGTAFNPHLFASPRRAARQVQNIAAALAELAPAEKALLARNAQATIERLNALADECAALGQRIANPRIVTQHGVFDYLAQDMGLEIVASVAAHPGQDPSAAEILRIVRTIREGRAAALFTEPQYPGSAGAAIARESGIPLATLDPAASGPDNPSMEYYERTMRANLKTLAQTLGTK